MHAESSEHFCTACGLAGGLRISLRRPDVPEPEELVLERPFAMLGASPANDVVLDHAAVSRRHAYLQAVAGRVYCIDLGSRTGLVWDRQIRPSGWVGAGEEVFIGPFRFTTSASPAASPVAPDPAEGWDPLHTRIKEGERMPALVLEMDSAGYKRTRWQLSRVLALVGRDRGCKLWLAAESVSAFHCSLVGTPGGVWVVDLLSREGTYVNGNRVAFRRLEDGDRLRVGRVQIRAWYDSISGGASGTALAPAAEPAPPPPPARRPRPGRPAARPPARGGRGGGSDAVLLSVMEQFQQMHQQMFDQFQQSLMMMVRMFGTLHQEQMEVVREELDRVQELTRELNELRAELARSPAPPAPPASPSAPAAAPRPAPPPREPAGRAPGGRKPAAARDRGRRAAPPPQQPAVDPHVWLTGRIAELERERQGKWQKILSFLTGK